MESSLIGCCNHFSDLKPTNIGFDDEDQVKIFDFGLAREIPRDTPKQKSRLMTGGAGTPRYMAPEVAAMSENYGFPADVYSFMILLWQILTTRTPFADILSPAELASKVLKENKRPSLSQIDFSDSLKNLMKSGWSADPLERPSFSFICEELEKILTEYDDLRKGYFKRSGSDSTESREVDAEPTFPRNLLSKRRNVNSHHGASTLNTPKTIPTRNVNSHHGALTLTTSKPITPMDNDPTTRRVSV